MDTLFFSWSKLLFIQKATILVLDNQLAILSRSINKSYNPDKLGIILRFWNRPNLS